MKLSVRNTDALKIRSGKAEEIVFDDAIPGFGLRLREGGSRTFVFQYKLGAKHRRMSLGKANATTFDSARKSAKKLYARVQVGEDPAADVVEAEARAAKTFNVVAESYIDWQRTRPRKNGGVGLKPRSMLEIERHLREHAKPLHKLQIAKIRRADIATCIGTVAKAGPVTSNRVRASLSGLFSWAMTEGLVSANPVVGTRRNEETERDRVLSNDELRVIWKSLADDHFGAIVKLLMLTGQRKGEIAGLQWSEINDDKIELSGERTKNHQPHTVPLSEAASKILTTQKKRSNKDGTLRDLVFGFGDGPFSGWSGCKDDLDARIAKADKPIAENWVLHDLRRTVATRMADIGIQPHIIEAVLNHVSGHKAGVAGVYNKSTYEPEKATALARWAAHLMGIVEGRASNVVAFPQTA
jgi:integrase